MNSILKKGLVCGVAALTLGLAVTETSTPAMAFGRGGWHGGYGYHGGWGGRGYGFGALAGGLALGAIAAGAYGYGYGYPGYGYGYGNPGYGYGGCAQQQPVYDAYGYFRGYRVVSVC